jgi:hypothetical protein
VIFEAIRESSLGPYASLEDRARLYYGRLLWKRPDARARLLRHWTDSRHPHADRFEEIYRKHVERLLAGAPEGDAQLDAEFQAQGLSLRVVAREIPPVFGSFY